MFGSCVTRNPESSGSAEVEQDGVGAVTPLLPRRLSWWDLNSRDGDQAASVNGPGDLQAPQRSGDWLVTYM